MNFSKKGIRQIDRGTFLYSYDKDTIYDMKVDYTDDKILITILKIKQRACWAFKKVFNYNEINNVKNPLNPSNLTQDIFKDITLIIFNHNFKIIESSDCLTLTLLYDQNDANNRSVVLPKVVEKNDKPQPDYSAQINQLVSIINSQQDKIAKLQQNEVDLYNRINSLEIMNKKLLDQLGASQENQFQSPNQSNFSSPGKNPYQRGYSGSIPQQQQPSSFIAQESPKMFHKAATMGHGRYQTSIGFNESKQGIYPQYDPESFSSMNNTTINQNYFK